MNNIETINKIKNDIKFFNPKTIDDIKKFKIKFLGKKNGIITLFIKKIKYIPISDRKKIGIILNKLKNEIKEKILKNYIKIKNINRNKFDITIPGKFTNIGSLHPISIIKNKIIKILYYMGFYCVDGNEIEDDWHNFTALNIPILHPSRDMQDTFFLQKNPDFLLRTHTSSVQIRYMKKNSPPFKVFSLGKVYRNETVSYNSNYMFHQVEGFYVNKNVSFCDLKETIQYMINLLFGKVKIRFRLSYFPFTEPSAEVDIFYDNKWLEIMGCGIIDPQVLKNVNIDSNLYTGFAFGLGIERLTMIIYNIKDIRIFFKNDIRFLSQFKNEF
ncbi:phenylalanine--tRNA ligase subunit alpha [Blattabacterium cuenoti]|uniref:phenylalanine--tRNA ligase subunit alpha n=1 Tax=Blattabacterium cuenoti TaxID=1653831 RepID=UPI00374C8989